MTTFNFASGYRMRLAETRSLAILFDKSGKRAQLLLNYGLQIWVRLGSI
jgi:hypothetical protein